jgi:hypothetical protein
MSSSRLRLIVAAALFAAWLAWLGFAVSRKGTVQVVSRAQLAAATHWVTIRIAVAADGVPHDRATVITTHFGDAITGEIEVRNLPASATPIPVTGDSRTPPAGEYFAAIVKLADGNFRIAGLPRSPGNEAQTPERPVIYPWTPDVIAQVERYSRRVALPPAQPQRPLKE